METLPFLAGLAAAIWVGTLMFRAMPFDRPPAAPRRALLLLGADIAFAILVPIAVLRALS